MGGAGSSHGTFKILNKPRWEVDVLEIYGNHLHLSSRPPSPPGFPLAWLAGRIPVEMRVGCRESTVRFWSCVFATPATWTTLGEGFTVYATMPSPAVVAGSRRIFVIFYPIEDIAPFCTSHTVGFPSGFWRIGGGSSLFISSTYTPC